MISTPIRLRWAYDPAGWTEAPWHAQDEENGHGATWAPALDAVETEDAYLLHAEIPGVKTEDIEITWDEGTLTLSGTRAGHAFENARTLYSEMHAGAFRRRVRLPAQIDASRIEARMDNGILLMRVPKAETARRRRIEVQTAAS
jgi:HSP20 family protein